MVDRLDKLGDRMVIGHVVDRQGRIVGDVIASDLFRLYNNNNVDAIETRVSDLEFEEAIAAAEAATTAAQAAADAAQTAADGADTAAAAAQDATDANARFLSISNSNVTGCTITATDAGANATVTISAHTRNYADGTSVAVTGGSVTGLAYSTQFFIYYDQTSLAGGAVTYAAVTSGPDAQPTAAGGSAPDRHYVGSVVTPAAAGGPILGAGAIAVNFDVPPGGNWL